MTAGLEIRPEGPDDAGAIRALTRAAFASAPHASGTEAAIIDALREAGALTLSLVAVNRGELIGHAAFSAVTIDGADAGWFGLGPVSVCPGRQRAGIGSTLVREGIARVEAAGAAGCVVLGDPGYYGRFGFVSDPALTYPGVPPEYFQRMAFGGAVPHGVVEYHPAFGAT